jgi:hypothetical protein
MSIVVTVRFEGDPDRMRAFKREHAGVYEELNAIGRRHGMIGHRQLYREGEILDIDEWETAEGRQAFLDEAAPQLKELAAFVGGMWQSTVWQPAEDV